MRWLEHLNIDLLPFWTTDTALGTPMGALASELTSSALASQLPSVTAKTVPTMTRRHLFPFRIQPQPAAAFSGCAAEIYRLLRRAIVQPQ
jgi:hypothetical protein